MAGKPNEYNTNTFIQYDDMVEPSSAFMTFMNDPLIQEILHVRGTNLPGLNFSPERRSRHLRDGHSDSTTEVIEHERGPWGSDGYFTPPLWQTCNDDINEGFSKDKKTQSVTALQYLSHHIRVLLYR